MKYADILRQQITVLAAERDALLTELDGLAEFDPTTDGEARTAEQVEGRVAEILERGTAIKSEIDAKQARAAELDALDAERSKAPFHHMPSTPQATPGDVRSMSVSQMTDAIVRAAEEREVDPTHARRLIRSHTTDVAWLRGLAARSTDQYADAWMKYATGRSDVMTAEERAAIAVGTNTQGGFLVPTFLDPTLIITSTGGGTDVIRPMARVVTLTEGNVWYGVTSGGVTASWDGELVEVSDDSPSLGSASIPVFKGAAFVQASVEALQDINGLASDLTMLFADARDRLEAQAHATGSGNGQPTGIFTALDANTNVELTSTTAATIGLVDLEYTKRSTPQKYRVNGSWVMNPVYGDAIKNLGTALSASYSTDLTQSNTDLILGRPARETDWAPAVQTTTIRDNEIVFGDFRNYVIVDKPGSTSIEYIPMMFNTANNLPDGRRGWYMWFRTGADSVNDDAFRLLQDKTSA